MFGIDDLLVVRISPNIEYFRFNLGLNRLLIGTVVMNFLLPRSMHLEVCYTVHINWDKDRNNMKYVDFFYSIKFIDGPSLSPTR